VPDDDSSGLLRDPDDWFSQTFPDGDGFGDWVQQAGFEPDEGESGRLQIDADLSGASAWSSLSDADKQRAMLEDFRHQWSTPDPRRPSADDDLAATDEIVSDEGLDSAAAAEAEAEAEIQASIAAEGKVRRAMWRLAGLVAVILFIYGCTEVLGSDDDTVTSVDSGETQDVDTVPTDASEGATSEPDQQATASPGQAKCAVGDEKVDPPDKGAIAAANGDDVARARLSVEVNGVRWALGSHIFTLAVAGDGRTVSTDPQTNWYNPRFVVNHDENNVPDPTGAFTVDVRWFADGTPDITVLDADFKPIPGAERSLIWLDQSTLEVTVSSPEIDTIEVKSVRMELIARVSDQDGVTLASPEGFGCWTPS
jgi:hypothetical protein